MKSWRGVPLTDIYGSTSPWETAEFPLVSPAYNHAVVFHVGRSGGGSLDRPPSPQRGRDQWNNECVRMPCSDHSLYPVQEDDGTSNLGKRWELITIALQKQMRNSNELAEAICSYNTKFKNQWKFRDLHYLFNDYLEEEETEYFFTVTLPAIAKLALALPQLVQSPIPLLRQHKNRSVSLSQQQISSLLANAFFCTFPRRNTSKKTSEYATYPYINFNSLYEASSMPSVMEKLKCICHYFRRVCTKVASSEEEPTRNFAGMEQLSRTNPTLAEGIDYRQTDCRRVPVGVVTFTRRSVVPAKCPAWASSPQLVGGTPLHVNSSGTIEDDGVGLIQVDFANKYLGGGVLNHGCVQEEIRFVICPELLVSMLFTEALRPTEALLMIGCERYSGYSGYGGTFQWTGDYEDETPRDASGRRRCAVLAIDALPFTCEQHQYRPELIVRELNKVWVGVTACATPQHSSELQRPGVATGNWGCGAFGGTATLKSLLQLMACAHARRPVAYYTFGDVELRDRIVQMYNFLSQRHVTVGQLYKYIIKFSKMDLAGSELYAFIHQLHTDETKKSEIFVESSSGNEPSNVGIQDVADSKTILKTHTDSPDMFSSGEIDALSQSFIDLEKGEGTLHVNIEETDKEETALLNGTETSTSTLKPSKPDLSQSLAVQVSHQTASLFDDMTKFDEENARFKLKPDSQNRGETERECLPSPMIVSERQEKWVDSPTDGTEPTGSHIEIIPSDSRSVETEGKTENNVASTSEKVTLDSEKRGAKKMTRKITHYFNKKF